jgi:hypothetical protein
MGSYGREYLSEWYGLNLDVFNLIQVKVISPFLYDFPGPLSAQLRRMSWSRIASVGSSWWLISALNQAIFSQHKYRVRHSWSKILYVIKIDITTVHLRHCSHRSHHVAVSRFGMVTVSSKGYLL